MIKQPPLVLISRPQEQSYEFQKMLGENVKSLISPILEIQMLWPEIDPTQYEAFVFTSRNGVKAANRLFDLKGLKAFVVGQKTAEYAASLGMKTISAKGNSEDLLTLIKKKHSTGKLLFLRGEHSTGNIAEALNSFGLETNSILAYRQNALRLSAEAQDALCGANSVLIPLFSPRTAGLMGSELKRIAASARLCLIGMSENVTRAWTGPKPLEIVVSDEPSAAAMVEKTLQQHQAWS